MKKTKIYMPFKVPKAEEARESVCQAYWDESERRAQLIMRDPKVIAYLKAMGAIREED